MKRTSLTADQLLSRHGFSSPPNTFESLYTQYASKVYRKCLSMTKDADMAQDYTQDIFIKAFEKFASFQNRSSLSTWLYSITYNYCADQIRLAKRLPTTNWLPENPTHDRADTSETDLHEETLQVVRQALGRLSVEERTLLRLKYNEGLTISELTTLYALKPSAVKMRLRRSRKRIQLLYAKLTSD
ncbi:RNA polymerase sigma factor [Spirosoma sp. KCTC 42546]|uniref:RNA polymerase sigma factor n=1 Tax=Spirosoma sp. KCTC 42546 TaxID=2520506 RepID=UPI001158321A|nr:RNA polymerase sigma factor [Spirosoma sp. KCTC 42546]QDK81587.1 RNA polymerase sigma factor [Spirosoma sp. KCTC 42546]